VNYNYDLAGNRTLVSDNGVETNYGTANNLNQYASGSLGLPYDSNGNLAGQPGWTYTYDAHNRLTNASGNGITMAFAYDGRSRCVKRTLGDAPTYLYYDSWNLMEEHGPSGIQARYVHGATIDELLARISGTSLIFYHHDALGSTVALSDRGGSLIERYSYDVYGAPMFGDGAGTSVPSSANGNRFLFTGREYLPNLALYDYRHRLNFPAFGRFAQTDPIRFSGGDVNIYRYAVNNPVMNTDPEGLNCGSGWSEPIVPDSFGVFDFTYPCFYHDECYGTCGQAKSACDSNFLEAMNFDCVFRPLLVRIQCQLVANLYYGAVRAGGCDAYKSAQQAAGNCEPVCD
jgi:RHS repeat-associated protein